MVPTPSLATRSALECKYIVVDERTGREVRWQEGGNMLVTVPASVQVRLAAWSTFFLLFAPVCSFPG